VACARTRQGLLIDPGDEVHGLLDFISKEGISIAHILLTHAHIDHITGVGVARRALHAPVHLHRDDLFFYDNAVEQGLRFGVDVDPALPPIDSFYGPHETIPFGEFEVSVHHTPGHCPGGVCLAVGRSGERATDLFVGDTLFAGSIGRTDLPGGDHATLLGSIRSVLFPFGDEARVYPGHGPDTTIGRERRTNPFLQAL
jgi:glyoxylase-like metal-dependent hydrolase (beta-lactamase superfamily II)